MEKVNVWHRAMRLKQADELIKAIRMFDGLGTVRKMINMDPSLANVVSRHGVCPLLEACLCNASDDIARTIEIAKILLEAGANPNWGQFTNGLLMTPLHMAVQNVHSLGIAQMLIDVGANIEFQNEKGRTALHRAAWCGNRSGIQLLLDNGANLAAKDRERLTPLRVAIDHLENGPEGSWHSLMPETVKFLRCIGAPEK